MTIAAPRVPSQPSVLHARHRAARHRDDLRAALLFGPLLLFVLVFFAAPILAMLYRSVDNQEVPAALPRTLAALATWTPADGALPPDAAWAALRDDLATTDGKLLAAAGGRLNYEIPRFRSLLAKSARRIAAAPPAADARGQLLAIDEAWGELAFWSALKRNALPVTGHYYLTAFDLERDARNAIVHRDDSEAIFLQVLGRTLWISGVVTLMCLVIAYPVAYTMTIVQPGTRNLMMLLVLIPLWTSLLVRSIAWVVLLQREGLVNDALMWAGLIDQRVRLVFNRTGLLIAMVHVLLPFMLLPIYSGMRKVGPQYVRAAQSLGAGPLRAFLTVYLPLTMPGVTAGAVLVFIVAIGYYITPELVGGADDQMLSHFIAYYTNQALNWGQAAALAVVLLASILLIYAVYARSSRALPLLPR